MRERHARRVMTPVIAASVIPLSSAGYNKATTPTVSMPSTPTASSTSSSADTDLPSLPPPPPSPQNQHPPTRRRRMSSDAVDRVLEACRLVDSDATLSSATFTHDGSTRVAIRSGVYGSVQALREGLQSALPLAEVDLSENCLDGTLELIVVVALHSEERRRARKLVSGLLVPRLLRVIATVLICSSFGSAVADMASTAPSAAPAGPESPPESESVLRGVPKDYKKDEL